MSSNTPPTAWLYLRLSAEKTGSADSLAAQEKALRTRADAEGLEVGAVFSEGAGRSAFRGKDRPEWARLLSEVRPGVVVMAVEVTRLTRDEATGFGELNRLHEAGAYVLTLDGVDTRHGGAELPTGVRILVAAEESRAKSTRILRRKTAQRLKGQWLNRAPYGHRIAPSGRLELDPETAPHLRRLVDLALEGEGASRIARTMNAEGHPVPGADFKARAGRKTKEEKEAEARGETLPERPREWTQMTVSALLRSPVLVGLMPHRPTLENGRKGAPETFYGPDGSPVRCVDGPTIATEGEWGTIRAMVAERSRLMGDGRRRSKGRPTGALLSDGLLVCGRCGATMAPSGPQYVCSAARSGKGCDGLTVQRHVIEPEAIRRVTAHLAALDPSDPEDLERLDSIARAWMVTATEPEVESQVREAAGKLAGARERLARLEEAHYVEGTIDADRFEEMSAAIRGQVETLEAIAGKRPGSPDLGPLLDVVQSREALEEAPAEVGRSLVAAVASSLTIAPPPYKGARFDPARLSIEWSTTAAAPAA